MTILGSRNHFLGGYHPLGPRWNDARNARRYRSPLGKCGGSGLAFPKGARYTPLRAVWQARGLFQTRAWPRVCLAACVPGPVCECTRCMPYTGHPRVYTCTCTGMPVGTPGTGTLLHAPPPLPLARIHRGQTAHQARMRIGTEIAKYMLAGVP